MILSSSVMIFRRGVQQTKKVKGIMVHTLAVKMKSSCICHRVLGEKKKKKRKLNLPSHPCSVLTLFWVTLSKYFVCVLSFWPHYNPSVVSKSLYSLMIARQQLIKLSYFFVVQLFFFFYNLRVHSLSWSENKEYEATLKISIFIYIMLHHVPLSILEKFNQL